MNDISNGANQAQAVQTQKVSDNALAVKKMGEEMEIKVMERISALQDAGMVLPEGYNASNAIKYAWLVIQDTKTKTGQPVIDACTPPSIANALLSMVLRGETLLNAYGYFIAYGDQLTYSEDYRGKMMRAIRDTSIADVTAQVIYEKDKFVYTVDRKGQYQLVEHQSALENIDLNSIKGAYAIVTYEDGSEMMTVMTMDQVKKAWAMGAGNGNTKAHQQFPDEMAKKTVIQRAVKYDLGKASEQLKALGLESDEEDEPNDELKKIRDNAEEVKVISEDAEAVEVEEGAPVPETAKPSRKKSSVPTI